MKTTKYPEVFKTIVEEILELPVVKQRQWFFTCPECDQTFTDPQEVAYGHDCEG
jgi:hypothetical protein